MKKLTALFLLGLMLVGCANPTLKQVDETVEEVSQDGSRRARYNDAKYISQSVPNVVKPGQKFSVTIKMLNTGRSTWTRDKMYRLGFKAPQDASTFGTHRIMLSQGVVYPGQVAIFTANLRAPNRAGDYGFRWRMLQELKEWFGRDTPYVNIKVGGGQKIYEVFEAEGARLFHQMGRRTHDGWRVTVRDPRNRYMTFGPYVDHYPRTRLSAKFYLKIDNNVADNLKVCRIDVVTNQGHNVLASMDIRRRDFWAPHQYQKFTLPFDYKGGKLEFRVKYLGYAQIDHDKTIIDN